MTDKAEREREINEGSGQWASGECRRDVESLMIKENQIIDGGEVHTRLKKKE